MSRWSILVLALVTVGAGGAGCGGSGGAGSGVAGPTLSAASSMDVGTPLAKVGEGVVGSKDFSRMASQRALSGMALDDKGRRDILDDLIDEEVVFQEGLRLGLYHDPKVRKALVNRVLQDQVYTQAQATEFPEAEMRAYFEAHKSEFVVPEKVQIKRIFLPVDADHAEAARIAEMNGYRAIIAKDPEQFKSLATQHSQDPYKRRGGDLGYVTREGKTGVDPAVVEKAFTLKPGELSEPFVAGGGVNLLLATNYRERVERTFEQMKGPVVRKMKNERYAELLESYVAKLRSGAAITVDDAALSAAEVDARPAPSDDEDGPSLPDWVTT